MLFAAGVAIPPGTKNLGDVIDQTDPCTLNPSDPICQLTAQDVANDPCKTDPTSAICQAAIVKEASSTPTPGTNSSQWASVTQDPSTTPTWVSRLLDKISGGTSLPALNTTNMKTSPLSTSIVGVPVKTVLIVLAVAGVGLFGYSRYRKRHPRLPSQK
jgi:lysozyme family protein